MRGHHLILMERVYSLSLAEIRLPKVEEGTYV